MKYAFIIIILTISLTNLFSQDYIIKLSYKKTDDNSIWNGGLDVLTIKQNQKIIRSVISDTTGIVKIPRSIIESGNDYDIFLTSIGVIENYLTTINKSASDTVFIKLPKTYNLRFGYAICPKCYKSNKVCKISTEPILIVKIVNGDTTYSPIDKRTYYSGTDVWHDFNPNWYCKRDSIKF